MRNVQRSHFQDFNNIKLHVHFSTHNTYTVTEEYSYVSFYTAPVLRSNATNRQYVFVELENGQFFLLFCIFNFFRGTFKGMPVWHLRGHAAGHAILNFYDFFHKKQHLEDSNSWSCQWTVIDTAELTEFTNIIMPILLLERKFSNL